jgi:hypothetical protein
VPIVWTIIVGGAVALLAGIWAAFAGRRSPATAQEGSTPEHATT